MRNLLKTLGNAAFVVGGFFAVFFGVSRFSGGTDPQGTVSGAGDIGVAYADAPYSQGTYGDCGDSSSSGDSDGGDSGCDGGDSGK